MKKTLLPAWLVSTMILAFIVSCTRAPVILYHDPDGIWRMKPDGSDITQITSFGWFGEYSPDNSKIAFSEFYDAGIWVAKADGTDPTRLTSFGSSPSWSPDGSQLVFHAGGQTGTDRAIWIMNADGTDVHQLSTAAGSFPDWSPAGDKILFHGEVNNGIWQINPDGSNETMLYRMGGYPAWSPDGEKIVYVDLNEWKIWVMDADGGNKKQLTDHSGMIPAWSADGSQIAYEGDGSIWIINSDGSGDHMILEEGRHPEWSK